MELEPKGYRKGNSRSEDEKWGPPEYPKDTGGCQVLRGMLESYSRASGLDGG